MLQTGWGQPVMKEVLVTASQHLVIEHLSSHFWAISSDQKVNRKFHDKCSGDRTSTRINFRVSDEDREKFIVKPTVRDAHRHRIAGSRDALNRLSLAPLTRSTQQCLERKATYFGGNLLFRFHVTGTRNRERKLTCLAVLRSGDDRRRWSGWSRRGRGRRALVAEAVVAAFVVASTVCVSDTRVSAFWCRLIDVRTSPSFVRIGRCCEKS